MNLYNRGDLVEDGYVIKLGLTFPDIFLGKKEINDFQEEYRRYGIKIPTEIVYANAFGYMYFCCQILGFGVYFTLQTDY